MHIGNFEFQIRIFQVVFAYKLLFLQLGGSLKFTQRRIFLSLAGKPVPISFLIHRFVEAPVIGSNTTFDIHPKACCVM